MTNQTICPKCKSKEVIKRGYRQTENRGNIQRFSCKNCKHRFVTDEGFFRMRNNPQKITLCMDLFYNGMSTRKIQSHLQAFYPHNSSYVSIYKWITKFSEIISKYTDTLKLQIGKEVQLDEMEYKTKGKKSWFIDCIDNKTRFMVSSKYTKERSIKELREVIKKIKEKSNPLFLKITTDGLQAYYEAIKKTFGYQDMKDGYIRHNQVNASKGEGFNYKIERLHNTIRQRTKTFRGFHGSLKSANSIMKGFAVYYNFIRVHQAINCCPYELATDLKLNNPNKWLDLIKLAKDSYNEIIYCSKPASQST